jgi:hypothetical protein
MLKNKKQKNKIFSSYIFFPKNRKGISIMIGYVLLITTAIVISAIVYQWVKSYVPTDPVGCPDDVSIFVKERTYTCESDILNITLRNNGKFNIGGYLIHATDSPEQDLVASISLSEYTPLGLGRAGAVIFSGLGNSFKPNDQIENIFDLSGAGIGTIYTVEVTPILHQDSKRIICGNAKVKEDLTCN